MLQEVLRASNTNEGNHPDSTLWIFGGDRVPPWPADIRPRPLPVHRRRRGGMARADRV